MEQISTSILIHAPTSKVWAQLMDFEAYPNWNPFIRWIKGEAREGAKISVRLEQPGSDGMQFNPRIVKISKDKEFRWLGHLFVPGLFDGEHCFELSENADGTTLFVQQETFKGILVPLFSKMIRTNTRKGFELMNEALKARCESVA